MSLEIGLRKLRKRVGTNDYNIPDFLTTFGTVVKEKPYPLYHNIKTSEDAISEDLKKVCMAYDDISDRGIVWVTEPNRVESYRQSLYDTTHIGVIGLIDLKSNIESFNKLLKDVEFLSYKDEIEKEIQYWSKYYKDGKGHNHFVFIGKNRSLYAIPKIYQDILEQFGIEQGTKILKEKFFVEVKTYTELVTRDYKTALYRNEKNNFKDTDLMEWIGFPSPITDLLSEKTKTKLGKDVFKRMFDVTARIKYIDRELVLDCYSVFQNKYGDKNWMKKQFEDAIKLNTKFTPSFTFFLNLYNHWYYLRDNGETTKIRDSHTLRMLMFKCSQLLNNGPYSLVNVTTKYSDVLRAIFQSHENLDVSTKHYGFRSDGASLTFKELKSGMKSSSGYFNTDGKLYSNDDVFDEDRKDVDYVSRKQGDVLVEVFSSEFFKVLAEGGKLVLPAKRGFTSQDFSYISKRDGDGVRINGEVYNKDGSVQLFSDIHPNDPMILEFGTNTEYVTLPFERLWGSEVQVDHIPPYSKNKDVKDLDKCELASAGFNNWKNDREAVYESKVISKISMTKELAEV